MTWGDRARAAVERAALEVVTDPHADPFEYEAARAYLARPKIKLEALPPAHVLITLAASYVRRGDAIPPPVMDELVAELGAACEPPAPPVVRGKCDRCADLADDDLAELRDSLDDDL